MKLLEKGLSTAAVIAALSTLACCVPLGFLGALGLASLSVWAQPLRPWLLGASVVLLAVGFVQLHVRKSTCGRRSAASLVIFWTAAVVMLLIILFPQIGASLIARERCKGHRFVKEKHIAWLVGVAFALSLCWYFLWSARTPKGQPPLTYLQPTDADQFKRKFDRAAANSRMVLLLSPI